MLNYTLFSILVFLTLLLMLPAIWQPRKVFQLPFCMAATMLLLMVPQAASLLQFVSPEQQLAFGELAANATRSLYPRPQTMTVILSLLIAILILVRIAQEFKLPLLVGTLESFRPRRKAGVLLAGILLALIAAFMNIAIWRTHPGNLHFFGQPELLRNSMFIAFSICFWAYLKRPTKMRVGLLVFAALTPCSLIVLFGKREALARILFILLLGLFFWKKEVPRKSLIAATATLFFVAFNISGAYRECVTTDSCSLSAASLVAAVAGPFWGKGHSELREAGHLIEYLDESNDFLNGEAYIYHVIHALVPAVIIGRQTKEALLSDSVEVTVANYRKWSPTDTAGVAWSGVGDTYLQFGYAGILVFLMMGVAMRILWISATRKENLLSQLLYLQLLPSCLRGLFHGSYVFTTEVVYASVLALFILLFSSSGRRRHRAAA